MQNAISLDSVKNLIINKKSRLSIILAQCSNTFLNDSINKKYLLSCRSPWYSMEQKPIAPIWVSTACRDGLKFIRNLANVNSLTTFHSVFINEPYEKDINVIFCYFLTHSGLYQFLFVLHINPMLFY